MILLKKFKLNLNSFLIIVFDISNLKYGVHSPTFSPEFNITCNSEGTKIHCKMKLFFKDIKYNILNIISE